MAIKMEPIGFVRTDSKPTTKCWRTSDVEGDLVIANRFKEGIVDLETGQHIVVFFHLNKSRQFSEKDLKAGHPDHKRRFGVFSTLSAVRPNPIGMSFFEVVAVTSNTIRVKGLDVADQTPILDIQPDTCPWECKNA